MLLSGSSLGGHLRAADPHRRRLELELEYQLLSGIFGASFVIPVVVFAMYFKKDICAGCKWFAKEMWESVKRLGFLCCKKDGRTELSEKVSSFCDDCTARCCEPRKRKKQKPKKKKRDPLQGIDLRRIAVAPRPPGVIDGDHTSDKPMTRAEKLQIAQEKAKEKNRGYTKQYRVVEKDSAGNEYITTDTTKSIKRKKHHSKKKKKKKKEEEEDGQRILPEG
jgi:hypothetical protein